MLLNNREIVRAHEAGEIFCDPFDLLCVGSAQLDVHLGRNFWVGDTYPDVYNPSDEESVRRHWRRLTPWRNEPGTIYNTWTDKTELRLPLKGLRDGEEFVLLEPGQMILGHTEEFVGSNSMRLTSMLKARSTMGRSYIEVCRCAGMGDVGYCNRWTLEICNTSRNATVILVVGRRIAQVLFLQVAPVGRDASYGQDDKYQRVGAPQPWTPRQFVLWSPAQLAEMKTRWTPEDMLPRQWLDRELRQPAAPAL